MTTTKPILITGGTGYAGRRRHSKKIRTGDTLDFWRVAAHEPPRRLLLLSEMKAPVDALFGFHIYTKSVGHVRLELVSPFLPKGLAVISYWYGTLAIYD